MSMLPCAAVLVLALTACLPEPGAIAPPPAPSADSLCSGSTLPDIIGSSITDIDDLASPVGAMIWDSTVDGTLAGDRVCTVTLISPSMGITAGHCFDGSDYTSKGHTLPTGVSTPEEICAVTGVQFNYQLVTKSTWPSGRSMPTYGCEEVLFQESSLGFDYALVRLDGAPGDRFGWHELDVDGHATGDTVTVISHPGGGAKKVSQGSIINTNANSIEHTASTQGGSSGAALLDDDGYVIGIHTEGASGTCTATNGNWGWSNERLRSTSLMPFLRDNEYVDLTPADDQGAGDRLGMALAAGDFDGDGADDLAMGAPYRDYGTATDAGTVVVRYGYEDAGLDPTSDQELVQRSGSSPEAGDHHGEVLAVGDFDSDGYDDLAVGSPDEDWGSTSNAGTVQIHYGSPAGLGIASQYLVASAWTGSVGTYDYFGSALAAGDFDADGYDDLAIGAYGDDSYAGRVYIATSDGSELFADVTFDQGDTGADTAEALDLFGWSLAAGDFDGDGADDLAVGAPWESFDTYTFAGQVTVVYGDVGNIDTTSGVWLELSWDYPSSSDRFGYALAAGDFAGTGYDSLAIGVPWWDDTTGSDQGMAEFRYGTSSGIWHLASYGIDQGAISSGDSSDHTGISLAWGVLDDLGGEALAIGATGDDEGGYSSSGLVMVTSSDDTPSMLYTTADPEPLMERTAGDQLGYALAAGDFDASGTDELAIGVPYADSTWDSDIGAVVVVSPW